MTIQQVSDNEEVRCQIFKFNSLCCDIFAVSPTGKRLMAVKASARLFPQKYSPKVKNAEKNVNNGKNSAWDENAGKEKEKKI